MVAQSSSLLFQKHIQQNDWHVVQALPNPLLSEKITCQGNLLVCRKKEGFIIFCCFVNNAYIIFTIPELWVIVLSLWDLPVLTWLTNTICDLLYLYDHKKTQHLSFTLKILIWKAERRPLSSQKYFSLHRKQVLFQNAIFEVPLNSIFWSVPAPQFSLPEL